jgi:hypothetical protein
MSRDGYKLEGEHRPDCRAVDDPDGLTYIVHGGADHTLRRNGHRGGSTMWQRFRCNDPHCRAAMLVRWDVLARFVKEGDR